MATTLPWQPPLTLKPRHGVPMPIHHRQATPVRLAPIRAFRRSDIDGFARRMVSGEALRDAWRSANNGFEQVVFEARKAAERLDRRYSLSRRLSSVAQTATDRAREIDREFEIGLRWRTFTMDFSRNWPGVCSFSLSLLPHANLSGLFLWFLGVSGNEIEIGGFW